MAAGADRVRALGVRALTACQAPNMAYAPPVPGLWRFEKPFPLISREMVLWARAEGGGDAGATETQMRIPGRLVSLAPWTPSAREAAQAAAQEAPRSGPHGGSRMGGRCGCGRCGPMTRRP